MKASSVPLAALIAIASAVVAFLAAPAPAESSLGSRTGAALAPRAEVLEGRVALAVAREGWPPMRSRARGEREARAGGPVVAPPPVYPLVLAAAVRRAGPGIDYAMTPPDRRPAPAAPDAAARSRARAVVAAAPAVSIALVAFAAALGAAALLRALAPDAPARRVARVMVAGGLGAGLYPSLRVAAALPGDLGADAFAAAMVAVGLFVTLRALRDDLVDRPVGSALRGGVAGLAFGLAIGSYTPAFAPLVGVQLGLLARLLARTRRTGPDGATLRARGLPILATSLHKAALLVLLPALVESPLALDAPWSAEHLSWLHFAWLGVLWFAFAPFALAPRLAGPRPVLAVAPAAALALVLLVSTDALAAPALLLGGAASLEVPSALARSVAPSAFGALLVLPAFGALVLAARRAPAGLVALLALTATALASIVDARTLALLAPAMAPAAIAFAPHSIGAAEDVRSR